MFTQFAKTANQLFQSNNRISFIIKEKKQILTDMFLIIFLTLFAVKIVAQVNIICNGDFESYLLSDTGLDSSYEVQNIGYGISNQSCWFVGPTFNISKKFQIKTPLYPKFPTQSKVLDLNSKGFYMLCQMLNLPVNTLYLISYNVLNDPILANVTLIVTMNNQTLLSKYYTNSNVIYTENIIYNSKNYTNNLLCFKVINAIYTSYFFPFKSLQFGLMLDNISMIVLSSNQSLQINSTISNNNIINATENSSIYNINPNYNTNQTFNTSSNPSSNINTNNNTYNTQNQIVKVYINFTSSIDEITNKYNLYSRFNPQSFGIPISFFQSCQIRIQGVKQNNIQFSTDENGYLFISWTPQQIYDRQSMKTLTIKYPIDFTPIINNFQLILLLDGQQLNYNGKLTDQQTQFIGKLYPIVFKMNSVIKNSFLIMSASSCSYFILNIIGFYNLSLMYFFLNLTLLPSFTRAFLINLTYLFFARGSIQQLLVKLTQKKLFIDFSFLQIQQKIPKYLNTDQYWFGSVNFSSNYLQNNFDSLCLLVGVIVKYIILRLITLLLGKHIHKKLIINFSSFYQHFINQISCFFPFFIVSAVSSVKQVGSTNLNGFLNDLCHIITFFFFNFMALVGLCESFIRVERDSKIESKIFTSKTIKFTRKQQMLHLNGKTSHRYSGFLLGISISTFVIVNNSAIFFIINTPIILWRFYQIIKHRKYFSIFQKIVKFSNALVWIIYHFSFMAFLILEKLNGGGSVYNQKISQCSIVFGFIIIFIILLGAFIDLLQVIVTLVKFIYSLFIQNLIVKLMRYCKKNHIIFHTQQNVLKIQEKNSNDHIYQFNKIKNHKKIKVKFNDEINFKSLKKITSHHNKDNDKNSTKRQLESQKSLSKIIKITYKKNKEQIPQQIQNAKSVTYRTKFKIQKNQKNHLTLTQQSLS